MPAASHAHVSSNKLVPWTVNIFLANSSVRLVGGTVLALYSFRRFFFLSLFIILACVGREAYVSVCM